jgi:ComF family protein
VPSGEVESLARPKFQFKNPLQFLAEALCSTLVPAECRICGDALTNVSRLPVCGACLSAIRPVASALCEVCGERLPGVAEPSTPARCRVCLRYRYPFRRAVAFTAFDGEARELIHLLKYQHVKTAATNLGRMLALAVQKLQPDVSAHGDPVLVTIVPLHRTKQRSRGFNQSDLIARSAVRQLKHMWKGAELSYAPRLLERVRVTDTQTGLTRHQRRANLRGAFRVLEPEKIKNCRVLLLDDVLTTGTTVAECARTLRRAGAREVWAATIARVYRFTADELEQWNFNTAEAPPTSQAFAAQHPMG